jgi:hypothetical protein
MSKESNIKAAQAAVASKIEEAARVNSELAALKLLARNAVVSTDEPADESPPFED